MQKTKTTPPLYGNIAWKHGVLVFQGTMKVSKKELVGKDTLKNLITFTTYLAKKNTPNNVNVLVMRRLFHNFKLESILEANNISLADNNDHSSFFQSTPAGLFNRLMGVLSFKKQNSGGE